MPTYHLTAPNGRTYKMTGPAGLRQQDIVAHVLRFDPEAGVAPPLPKTGTMAALQSGAENWYTSGKAGIKGLFGDEQAAAEEALAAQQDQGRRLDPGVGLSQVGKAYDEGGIWGAGKEIISQVPRALAQSAPDIAGALAGARVGAMVGAPLGPAGALVGGIGGGILAGILPQTGRNLAAQQEETPGEVSYGKAVAAGGAQAALESVTPLALMGGRVASKVFGNDVTKLLTKLGPEAAEEVAKRGLLATVARGGAVGAGGEGTTEVMQEALGRLQAGKSLLDDDALSAYAEAAYGGVLAGAPLGGAGGAYDRSGAQQDVRDRRAAAEELAAQKVAEEQAEADAAKAQQDAERKADPGYAAHVGKQYAAYEAQKKAMIERRGLLQKEGTDAGKQEAKRLGEQIGEFVRASQPLIDEFNGVRATLEAQAKQQAAAAGADAAARAARGEPVAPEGALFGGYENDQKQKRIDQLKAQIAEHEQFMPQARDQMVEILRGGKSSLISQARAGMKQREGELQNAWKELDELDPTIRQQRDADELRKTAMTNFNPAKAQKDIAALTAKIEGVQDPDEASKALKWATDREKLQALLDEHQKGQTVELAPEPQGEDLFDLGTRLRREEKQSGQRQLAQERGLEALGRGEATQEWPNLDPAAHEPPGTAYGDTPENLAQETDAAFNRTFATQTRSGIVDALAQLGIQRPLQGEGGAIVERLVSLPDEDRADTAKELQAFGTTIKQKLYSELQQARAGNKADRAETLLDAIRSLAALEQETKGRAHYTSDFYNITAPLVPGVLQEARSIVGVRAPSAATVVAGQKAGAKQRLARTDDPAQTAAMEAALEGETIEKPRAATGQRYVGKGPQRAEPRTTETGQGFLFEPAPAPAATADTPRQLVQQRIGTLLAMPSLQPQAKRELQRAADALDGATVAPRVLENITEMVARAERGVGFTPEGADKPAARPKIVAQEGKARVAPKPPAAVKPQVLETEPVATAEHIDADVQPDLIDAMYVGRATPQTFQRALDTGALPSTRATATARKHSQGLLTAGALLRQQANNVKMIIADVAKARTRLQAVDKTLAAMDPKSRKQRADQAHEDMKEATNAALRASDAAKKANARADEAKAAKEDAQEKKYRGRADRAEQEARRQEESVENYKAEIRAINEADVAPALERVAKRHDALVEEAARIDKEIAKNDADLKARHGEFMKAREKQQAAGKRVSKAPDVERKGPRILRMEQPRVKAPEPTEEERRTSATTKPAKTYAAETGERVTRVEARQGEPGLDLTANAVDDAIDTAMAVPGVKQEALREIFNRVRKLLKPRALSTRAGVIERELGGIAGDLSRHRAANPGGVVPARERSQYNSAVLRRAHLEDQFKAAKTADARKHIQGQLDLVEVVLKDINARRTPLANDVQYRELQRQAALKQFESDVIEMQRNALKEGEGYTPLPQRGVLAPDTTPGTVEPATRLAGEAVTRMGAAKATKQQKTRFQGKRTTPTAETEEKNEAINEARRATDEALMAARDTKEAKGKPRKLTPLQALAAMQAVAAKRAQAASGKPLTAKDTEGFTTAAERAEAARAQDDMAGEGGIPTAKEAQDTIAEMFAQIAAAPLSEANMDLAHDGQLLSVLDSLASTSESPVARELAAKLRPLLLRTKLRVEADPNKPHRAGLYDSKTNTITLNPLALNEETLLHEAVHAATLRLLSAPTGLTREQTNARNELLSMLKRVQKDPAFSNEYGETNIAEFASEVLTNPDLRAKLDKQKPGFWKRLINAVLQMFGVSRPSASDRAMSNVEKMFEPSRSFSDNEWEALQYVLRSTQSPRARKADGDIETPKDITFSQMLSADATKTGLRGVIEGGNKALAAEMALVDQRAPILQALSKGTQQAYQQAMYFLRKSDARMAQVYSVLQNGPAQLKRDKKGNHIVESGNGPSAKALFEEIGKLPGESVQQKFADAQAYMVAQRAANKGWDKLGWETSAEKQAAAKRMMAEIDADPAKKAKLEAVRSMYNDYNKGLVQFLADTGAISKELAATLTKDGDYVPFYRVNSTSGAAELVMGEGTHIRVGDVRKQPHLQALKGDEGKLLPLNEAIMRNTMLLTDMGLSNLATKNIAYALQNMSPKDVNRIHSLKKGQQAPAGADIVKFKQDGEDRWMRITSEGTPFEGIPAEMLVQSLEGTHTMLTGMGKVGQWFGDVLRSGITRNPAYVLRQLIRDPMSAAFTAGTSRGPLGAMMESMREFASQTQGNSKTAETLLRKGVAQSGIFSGDADDLNKFALQLASGEQGAITRLISMADRAAMRADAATRAQVYEDALKATGSEMQAEMAAMEMMNFSKRGSSPTVQNAARLIPFLNAQLQGLNVLYKAVTGQMSAEQAMEIKAKFIRRAIGMSAMSFAYALGMEDNEEYKNATAEERASNFFVPYPGGALKIPIPYEVGLLFKVLPEAAARAMSKGLDEADWAALRTAALRQVPGASNALVLPQAVKPLAEIAFNHNIYTGGEIESEAQQKLDPGQRFNESTSELAKAIGDAANISPLKIEHLVRGYLGGLPIAAASLANELVADKSTPDRKASQSPIVGGFIADSIGRGAVERAYAKSKAIAQAGATYDKLVSDGKYAAAIKYRDDNLNVMMAEPLNDRFTTFMNGIRAERARVLQSDLSGSEKRRYLDEIEKHRNKQADLFVDAVKAVTTAH